MATNNFSISVGSWDTIANNVALIIIKETGDGFLYIGNAADTGTARRFSGPDEIGRQIEAQDAVNTYARASGTGWVLAVTLLAGGRLPDGGGAGEVGGDRYPPSVTDPTVPAPNGGDVYYNTVLKKKMFYDAGRAKWLSIEVCTFEAGRANGITAAGAYYLGIGLKAFSTVNGYVAGFNGTVVAFNYTRDDVDPAPFEITDDGVAIAEIASAALKGEDTTLDADFASASVLGIKNKSGGNATDGVMSQVTMRWRV